MTNSVLPYGRQSIDQQDIDAVVDVLKSSWLTTGPKVEEFERAVAQKVGSRYGVAVNSGTAALHCAMAAIGIGPGDEVIVPSITFLATANCVVFQGGTPVFADVQSDNLLIDPLDVEKKITPKTKAIIAVDFAGHPCDYTTLRQIATRHGLVLVADACHSLGASYRETPVGSLADITLFSFHPVKVIAAGEGGMLLSNDKSIVDFARSFRNHGMTVDHKERNKSQTWRYDMHNPGYNYRLSDIHAALGLSQLSKLEQFIERRQAIAAIYDHGFENLESIAPLFVEKHVRHAFHLYVVEVREGGVNRDNLFSHLREQGIGVNVHYYPVHLQPFYHRTDVEHTCPIAEEISDRIISLPMFPAMTDIDANRVIDELSEVIKQGQG